MFKYGMKHSERLEMMFGFITRNNSDSKSHQNMNGTSIVFRKDNGSVDGNVGGKDNLF